MPQYTYEDGAKPNDWIYIYYIRKSQQGEDITVFDRSVSRTGLGPIRAEQRVKELRAQKYEAFYIIGNILPGALS